MSSWNPNDLATDDDLIAYESEILTRFGAATWATKRTRALEDWVWPRLRREGYTPSLFRTRYDVDQAWQFTGAAYTDLTTATQSRTAADVDLAAIFATPGTDALYLGSTEPFRGLSIRILDAPSATTSDLTASYWAGLWRDLTIDDGTVGATGITLSQGGSVRWPLPPDWVRREVSTSDELYYVRLMVSATPASATAAQIAAIRTSMLRAVVVYKTLHFIFAEAPTSQEGPWSDKATFYEQQADLAMERALPLIGGEFDADESGQVSASEADATAAESGRVSGFALERA